MSKAQQIRFLELIYDNQSVFSLCDEDLGLCDCLKHTILTAMDKPVYLLHRTIQFSYKLKSVSAWIPGLSKVLSGLLRVPMHHWWLLSIKKQGKSGYA